MSRVCYLACSRHAALSRASCHVSPSLGVLAHSAAVNGDTPAACRQAQLLLQAPLYVSAATLLIAATCTCSACMLRAQGWPLCSLAVRHAAHAAASRSKRHSKLAVCAPPAGWRPHACASAHIRMANWPSRAAALALAFIACPAASCTPGISRPAGWRPALHSYRCARRARCVTPAGSAAALLAGRPAVTCSESRSMWVCFFGQLWLGGPARWLTRPAGCRPPLMPRCAEPPP